MLKKYVELFLLENFLQTIRCIEAVRFFGIFELVKCDYIKQCNAS